MRVNICGLPHEVLELEDNFNMDCHMGQIEYKDLVIKINKNMPEEHKKETLCHEMIHGILVHLGYMDQSQDEQFVQALGNAIYQGFEVKDIRSLQDIYVEHDGCKGCKYKHVSEDDSPCSMCKQRYYDQYEAKKVE